MGDGIPLSIID